MEVSLCRGERWEVICVYLEDGGEVSLEKIVRALEVFFFYAFSLGLSGLSLS